MYTLDTNTVLDYFRGRGGVAIANVMDFSSGKR